MKSSRNRKLGRANMLAVLLAWVAIVAAPCGMASVPMDDVSEQSATEVAESPHEHCMSMPMGSAEAEPESGKCCDPTLAIKPSDLKVPSIEIAFFVTSILAVLPISETGGLPAFSPESSPSGSSVPVYLSTLRLRI